MVKHMHIFLLQSSNTFSNTTVYQIQGDGGMLKGRNAVEQKLGFSTVPCHCFIDVGRHRKMSCFLSSMSTPSVGTPRQNNFRFFWELPGAAGVPTAVLELAIYALQPYLLCTWATSLFVGLYLWLLHTQSHTQPHTHTGHHCKCMHEHVCGWGRGRETVRENLLRVCPCVYGCVRRRK